MAHVQPPPDLAGIRRSYEGTALDPATVARSWSRQLEAWLEDAVAAGMPDPTAMTLATVDADGRPSARTVLCKGIDDRGVVFFTNRHSRKGRALHADSRAALTFVWLPLHRQVCITGDAGEVSREQTEAYVRSRPRGSQLSAWASRQSEVIVARDELVRRRDELEQHFAGADIPVPEFWGGYRVSPLTVEFWSGRPDRLHDRVRYRRSDGVAGTAGDGRWVIERLAP